MQPVSLYDGYDDTPLSIDWINGGLENEGLHICLDTIGQNYTGYEWQWFGNNCNDVIPDWGPGGPQCFTIIGGCCGRLTNGYTGNTDCDDLGKRNLADITRHIDHVYVSKEPLCCKSAANTDGDELGTVNLGDITRLIDHVYVSKEETAPCQ